MGSLVDCPSCARPVSVHAAACPGCGHPLSRRPEAGSGSGLGNSHRKLLFACCLAAVLGAATWFGASAKVKELDHAAVLILTQTRGAGPGESFRREQAFYQGAVMIAPFVVLGAVVFGLYVGLVRSGDDR